MGNLADQLTIIVPAYNEAASLADTIKSIRNQTTPPQTIIVVNDCSTDSTGRIARSLGVIELRTPKNTGSKAGAQNYALALVNTKFTMCIDADTSLAPDAIEKLLPALADEHVAAACGFVVPRYVNSLWERGRYIEYIFAFSFYKPTQDYYSKPLISSGCFSAYNTRVLKKMNGWSERTRAEDMDLTWSLYEAGYNVKFIPEAVCYPIEPHDFNFMGKQLKRWSHGFIQNVRLHWNGILRIKFLSYMVGIGMCDAIFATIFYFIALPIMVIVFNRPVLLLGYLIDFPAILFPVLLKAIQRNEFVQALFSLPAFFILRLVNSIYYFEALISELILNKSLLVYEKGH